MTLFFNPSFDQIVNPGYLDILDCPYLNYVKAPTELDHVPEHKPRSVPQANVSNFIDGLESEWETLPEDLKHEYYQRLSEMLRHKSYNVMHTQPFEITRQHLVENNSNSDTDKDNKWGTNTIIFMIILTVVVNLIMWHVLNNKN